MAASIRNFFESPANRALLTRFRELGLWPVSPVEVSPQAISAHSSLTADTKVTRGPLSGKNVLFTGSLSIPRGKAQRLAEAAGAIPAGSVNRKLDYLVAGGKPGSKLDKAQALGIAVLDEAGLCGSAGRFGNNT